LLIKIVESIERLDKANVEKSEENKTSGNSVASLLELEGGCANSVYYADHMPKRSLYDGPDRNIFEHIGRLF